MSQKLHFRKSQLYECLSISASFWWTHRIVYMGVCVRHWVHYLVLKRIHCCILHYNIVCFENPFPWQLRVLSRPIAFPLKRICSLNSLCMYSSCNYKRKQVSSLISENPNQETALIMVTVNMEMGWGGKAKNKTSIHWSNVPCLPKRKK